jgi:hypothetical protein
MLRRIQRNICPNIIRQKYSGDHRQLKWQYENKNKKIGVIATEGTVGSEAFKKLQKIDPQIKYGKTLVL